MREILFRGKTENGEWVEGDYFRNAYIMGEGHYINTPFYDATVIPETIGQFTGLTDKNGTKIFEGDILEYWETEQFSRKIYVYFEDGQFLVSRYALKLLCERIFNSVVIGNIHDNPELLEE